MDELVTSNFCVDTCAVHTQSIIDNLWFIHLPQSCSGALGSVICILANVGGGVCGCNNLSVNHQFNYMVSSKLLSVPGVNQRGQMYNKGGNATQ